MLGADPLLQLRLAGDSNPLGELDRGLSPFLAAEPTGIPSARAVLAVGYDVARTLEHIPRRTTDDMEFPQAMLNVYGACLTIDRQSGRQWIVAESANHGRLLLDRLHAPAPFAPSNVPQVAELESELRPGDYHRMLQQALALIEAGDIYQVNLSQRFSMPLASDQSLFELFVLSRSRHPSDFGAYLPWGAHTVLSASPERFLRYHAGSRRLLTMPIKGTRPRMDHPSDDDLAQRELLSDPKEQAEHLMIVDLERNDLGRIAETGTVRVERFAQLQSFTTLHHLVSSVSATVTREKASLGEILRATFPGGSITGAPKVRAMEIIEALEPVSRGLYTGSIGYVDWDGSFDLNIAIRTAIGYRDRLFLHVGGGIVADSHPDREYEETLVKALSWIDAAKPESPPVLVSQRV